ncbi:SLBB domain-containing protein [Oscillatoriales cyanobacterium LEGE 11467]|uniref:SLBB domain-containing protein n=1 Tax=Zarconia navalis LEGE 11467 TaxID=1828826 RepID=A0A928Z8J9_9CYAN|nr:SLBB domain-containing protein [Zarconia navalis]MBE9041665.1 SLBB domain-containing protein [Zarconia navalis LEGE 11467]
MSFRVLRCLFQSTVSLTLLTLAIAPNSSMAQSLPYLEDPPPPPSRTSQRVRRSNPELDEYTLGPGDLVQIEIFEAPEYSGEAQVLANGMMDLPIGGRVYVEGLTIPQATDIIAAEYVRIFRYPLVSVRLSGPRPLQVTIDGEVTQPGAYVMEIPLKAQSGLQRGLQYPTVPELIELAGGVTLSADLRRVEVRRNSGNGKEPSFYIDLLSYIQSGRRGQDITLRDGDALFIPTAERIEEERVRQLAATNFAVAEDSPRSVVVVGAVNQPGNYVLIGGPSRSELRPGGLPTLTFALEQAGGIVTNADVRQVEIRRITQTGGEQIIIANLWEFLQTGDFENDPILQNGDTIVVPRTDAIDSAEVAQLANASFSASIVVYVVGEVNKAPSIRTLEVPTNTTLNQAILQAGGFTDDANRDEVDFIRLNPDGTVRQETIELDFARGIDEFENPLLRPNDIIVISRSGLARVTDTLETIFSPAPEINSFMRILETLGIVGD